MSTIPVIHAVTTDDIVARADFVGLAITVMRALGPRGAVHLRGAGASGRLLYDLAAALVPQQVATGAWLVVNDRIDVALCVGARGLQLTSRSLTFADAREVIGAAAPGTPRPAVGVSVHTAEEARASAAQSTDGAAAGAPAWLVAGHVFATPSHAGEPARGPSTLGEICAAVALPVIAIGGVRPADVSGLLAAGAYGVAAIRGIWRAVDAEGAARDYLRLMTPSETLEPLVAAGRAPAPEVHLGGSGASAVDITINGERRTVPSGATIADVLQSLSLDPRAVVVEYNREILRDRQAHGARQLSAGDVLELVHFVGGG